MKITTGVDIIEVDRIKKAVEDLSDSFLNRVYNKKELEYCQKSNKMKYQHLATRFAGKEAVFKAISGYIDRSELMWQDIEVENDANGRPKINMDKLRKCGLENLESIDISLSHIKEYAIANVVAVFH